jgi:hypothetical protein
LPGIGCELALPGLPPWPEEAELPPETDPPELELEFGPGMSEQEKNIKELIAAIK